MPTAHQPATPRDRAERHVFERLPELPAVERRVLALLELCDADRSAVAGGVGLDPAALRSAAAAARKGLRRSLAPLSSGARCERAEVFVSERIDGERFERKWLEIHLARCPRCDEHVALLERARAELRASFAAAPVALLTPAAEPPLLEAGEGAGRLRLVPAPPPAEPAAPAQEGPPVVEEPAIEIAPPPPVGGIDRPTADKPGPRSGNGRAKRVAQRVAVVIAVLALIAAIVAGAAAISGDDGKQSAPWSVPDAPNVRPEPLSGQ